MSNPKPRDSTSTREVLAIVGGGLLVLVCCAGPALLAAGVLGAAGGVAFTAGLLATVNPCGFAMLPAFLSFYVGTAEHADHRGAGGGRVGHGLAVGLAVSAGFASVFVIAALLASAGLSALVRLVPWAALGIGVVLVGQALAAASPLRLAGVLAGYAVGAASVLIALSVSAALAKDALLGRVRRLLPLAGRLGGGLLVVSGAYLVAYWAPTLAHAGRPTSPPPLVGVGTALSARLTTVLSAGRVPVAVLAGMLVAGGLALTIRKRHQSIRRPHAATSLGSGGAANPSPTAASSSLDRSDRTGGDL